MRIARLLALAFVFCSLSAFAQQQSATSYLNAKPLLPAALIPLASTTTASTPWRIPERMTDQDISTTSMTRTQGDVRTQTLSREDADKFLSMTDPKTSETEKSANDTACLFIRSYVVARDNKDSDATHLVSYSTCQPGSRYGVKTTELKQNPPNH
jgi:hypothetical protein